MRAQLLINSGILLKRAKTRTADPGKDGMDPDQIIVDMCIYLLLTFNSISTK